ncbi:stage II sporulation protein R [Evansella sp. AB-rgal1]|uniref:stage II sporulation protein R n=1 Tax=Evansella sp. AB-rgal1 TaxID=3242696 RepID=UPI00359DDD15
MNHRIKIYLLAALSILILSWESQVVLPSAFATTENGIPEESIRLRILANSNSPIDQSVKRDIRDEINAQITQWVEHIASVEDARDLIDSNMDVLYDIVEEQLKQAGSKESFDVSLQETNFPTKLYGNRLYPAGEYEAVLVSIGDGRGDNWWCVLFPPLCFLDFSNGDAVAHESEANDDNEEEEEEVEVAFFLVELVTSIWNRLWS